MIYFEYSSVFLVHLFLSLIRRLLKTEGRKLECQFHPWKWLSLVFGGPANLKTIIQQVNFSTDPDEAEKLRTHKHCLNRHIHPQNVPLSSTDVQRSQAQPQTQKWENTKKNPYRFWWNWKSRTRTTAKMLYWCS